MSLKPHGAVTFLLALPAFSSATAGYSPASSPSDQSSSELSHSQLVAATVVPVLGGLALLAAVLLVLLMYLHRSRHHRTLLGHIKPPPASPGEDTYVNMQPLSVCIVYLNTCNAITLWPASLVLVICR
jgi:hypothetical protein